MIKEAYDAIARKLPHSAVLIVVPQGHSVHKDTLLETAKDLAANGHQVRVLSIEEVSRDATDAASRVRRR